MFCEWWGAATKTKNLQAKISEESPGPRRSSVFLLFQVFLTILVADDDERFQILNPRNWSFTKKLKKSKKMKKTLGPDIPENPLGFLFFQMFSVFLKCFGFFAILVADENIIRIQKNKKQRQQKFQASEESPGPKHFDFIFGSFGFPQVFLCFLQS